MRIGSPDAPVVLRYRVIFPNATMFWAFGFAISAPQVFQDLASDFDPVATHEPSGIFTLIEKEMVEYPQGPFVPVGEVAVGERRWRLTSDVRHIWKFDYKAMAGFLSVILILHSIGVARNLSLGMLIFISLKLIGI